MIQLNREVRNETQRWFRGGGEKLSLRGVLRLTRVRAGALVQQLVSPRFILLGNRTEETSCQPKPCSPILKGVRALQPVQTIQYQRGEDGAALNLI